jgi:hypothetical protein
MSHQRDNFSALETFPVGGRNDDGESVPASSRVRCWSLEDEVAFLYIWNSVKV